MPTHVLLLGILVGAVLFGALAVAQVFTQSNKEKFLILACLLFAIDVTFQIQLLMPLEPSQTEALLRLHGCTYLGQFAAILLYGRRQRERRLDLMDRTLLILASGLAAYSLGSNDGYWFASPVTLARHDAEANVATAPSGPLAFGYYLVLILQTLYFIRQFIESARITRTQSRADGLTWCVGVACAASGALYDSAVDSGAIRFPRLGGLAFAVLMLGLVVRSVRAQNDLLRTRNAEIRAASELAVRLRELFDKAADAIFVHDADTGRIVDVNFTATELYGYSAAECKALAVSELSAPGFENSQERALECFRADPSQIDAVFLWQAKRKDKREFFAEAILKRMSIAAESCIVVTVRDVSERVASAMELKREENFVSTLLDSLPGAFYLCDKNLRLRRWNRNLEKKLGYDAEVLSNMSMLDWFPEGPRKVELLANMRKWLVEGQGNLTQEVRVLRADGCLVPYLTTSARLDTHEGAMVMGVGIDMSDLVEAQAALRESEERHRLLFNSAGDAILLLDEDRIVDGNARALALFGCTEHSDLVGQSFFAFSPDTQQDGTESAPSLEQRMQIAKAGAPQRFEWRHKRLDGTLFLSEVSFNLLELRGKRHIQVIVRDITEKRQLEERLIQAQRLEAIGHLAGGVAHDFNNLLTPILGNLEMVLGEVTDDELLREALEEAHEAADRAKRLARQLLTFGRRTALEVTSVDLCELVRSMERLLRGLLREDIELRLHLVESGVIVKADASQIEQVIMNLVVNARDAMPKGGRVSVSVGRQYIDSELCSATRSCRPGEYSVLSVADTGSGMSDEVKKHLFEPFYTTKSVGQGTGLGLCTVFGIVEQHHGTLSVYSELGQGSTLNVFLPLESGTSVSESERAPDSSSFGGTETILVVEDDETVRGFVQRTLVRHGYVVHAASSSEEALSVYGSLGTPPDLVLTDVVLPGMNGHSMLQQMRASGAPLRVLYMSGYAGDTISQQGIFDADAPLLQKPFSTRDLLIKIRAVLST